MKNDWKDEKVDINDLNLDLNNPRLPRHVKEYNDVNQVRNYLLDEENVLDIAKSIARNGYHRSAVAIVCKENGKLVVLDGNRRLAACQFLLNPGLAPNARRRKEFETLNKILDKKQLKNVKIAISPSRKDAEKEIWNIHVNTHLLKPWEVLQKLRMYKNLIDFNEYTVKSASLDYGLTEAEFQNELKKLFFYEQILEREPDKEDGLLKFGFNKIDRILASSNGQKLLGYDFDTKGNIIVQDKARFEKRFKQLIPYILDPKKVKPQVTQTELVKEVFSVLDPSSFPIKTAIESPKRVVIPTIRVPKTPEALPQAVPASKVKPDWITRAEYSSYKGEEKVKGILDEMSSLDPDDKKYIATISLRTLLELTLYAKLSERGYILKIIKDEKEEIEKINTERVKKGAKLVEMQKDWSPSFRRMLNYLTDEEKNVIKDPQTREALNKMIKGETDFVEDLNTFIHNVKYIPSKGDPEKIWSKFGRLLFETVSKI